MRIPTHNICRAFPELDAFSDEQCQRFLAATLKKHWLARHRLNSLTVILFLVGGFGMLRAFVAVVQAFKISVGSSFGIELLLLPAIVGAFAGALTGLMIRDRWLRRRLASRIVELACARCGYSLLGLAARDGIIICPECGDRCELASRGIEVDTTLVPESQPSGTA